MKKITQGPETVRELIEQLAPAGTFDPAAVLEELEQDEAKRAELEPRRLEAETISRFRERRGEGYDPPEAAGGARDAPPVEPPPATSPKRKPRKHLEQYRSKLIRAGQRDANPMATAGRAWGAARAASSDKTGKRARDLVRELPKHLATKIRDAALGITVDQATGEVKHRRTWRHIRARNVAAIGLFLYRNAGPTRRKGWHALCRGLPRNLIRKAILEPRNGLPYSLAALFAVHGDGGYVEELERAGALYRHQPPGRVVPASERGPSGHAFNHYWFPAWREADAWTPPELDDDAGELAATLQPAQRARAPA